MKKEEKEEDEERRMRSGEKWCVRGEVDKRGVKRMNWWGEETRGLRVYSISTHSRKSQ